MSRVRFTYDQLAQRRRRARRQRARLQAVLAGVMRLAGRRGLFVTLGLAPALLGLSRWA